VAPGVTAALNWQNRAARLHRPRAHLTGGAAATI
jgi:hypothetical protein